jgi:hypothetical protein
MAISKDVRDVGVVQGLYKTGVRAWHEKEVRRAPQTCIGKSCANRGRRELNPTQYLISISWGL